MKQTEPDLPGERLDAHNAAVSIVAVLAHRCGAIDLRTGRTCPLPEHHPGSCEFAADQQLTGTRPERAR